MRNAIRCLLVLCTLAFALPARADEPLCQEIREGAIAACYRANDTLRADCAKHCDRCSGQVLACFGQCEHYCDAPYYEGCGFDLNGCLTRCEHRCHDPDCEDNAACKTWWCAKENIKGCDDACTASYGVLAGCRALWCGDGRAKKSCLDGCNANQKQASACRKAWCGDGKSGRQCYHDADEAEAQCRKQVDADYKSCLEATKK